MDPAKRLTAEQALNHNWIEQEKTLSPTNLWPQVQAGFDAKKTFRKAIDVVSVINKMSQQNLVPKKYQDEGY